MFRQFQFVYWLSLSLYFALVAGFDFNDLKLINNSCYQWGSCGKSEGFRLDSSSDLSQLGCFCDDKCIEFGDCCLNAKAIDMTQMNRAHKRYECVTIKNIGSFYMKSKCANDWSSPSVAELCGNYISDPRSVSDDPFLRMPVTSLSSDNTFTNYYCALCNNEKITDIEIWNTVLSCPAVISEDQNFVKENIRYSSGLWGVYKNGSGGESDFVACEIYPAAKETVSHKLRHCKSYVDSCSSSWAIQEDIDLCHSYTTIVYGPPPPLSSEGYLDFSDLSFGQGTVGYRNYHCAICNHVNESDIECYERNLRVLHTNFNPVSFSVLFDFGFEESKCQKGELWDQFNKVCRVVMCINEDEEYIFGKCFTKNNSLNHWTKNGTNSSTVSKLKCVKMFLNESEFMEGDNGSIIAANLRRSFNSEEYEIHEDGAFVCISQRYSSLMGWLTVFGIGLSCICLLIHMSVFLILPDMRNLSGMNLFSFCISLLGSYSCFFVTSFTDTETNNCLYLAHIMYYFFLSSFTWVNVTSFDIWKTLQKATSELRLSSGKQWKKFIIYSIYAWSVPLFALILVISFDYLKPVWLDANYLPELGYHYCWFGTRNSIIVYFAAPLAVIMSLNFIFFIFSIRIVAFSTKSADNQRSRQHKLQLKLYLKLSLLMGLSWTSGLLAGYLQDERMWYIYILLNAFQGLFILLAFTLTKKVRRALKAKFASRSTHRTRNKTKNEPSVVRSQESSHTSFSTSSSTLAMSTNFKSPVS